MPDLYQTRAPRASDVPFLAAIADVTLFPGEMMEGMIAPAFSRDSADIWRVVGQRGRVVGFAFAQPEAMTDSTWNLRAIALSPDLHGSGAGTALIGAMEAAMHDARLIVIDTTQTPDQERARRFYASRGYAHVATIPAFFGADEDKVTFVKMQAQASWLRTGYVPRPRLQTRDQPYGSSGPRCIMRLHRPNILGGYRVSIVNSGRR